MPERRTLAKLVRFSPEELSRITERAHDCGRTPARYIRESALGAIPKSRHHTDRDALLRELARIGRELARLAIVREMDNDIAESPDNERLADILRAHRAALRAIVEIAATSHAA